MKNFKFSHSQLFMGGGGGGGVLLAIFLPSFTILAGKCFVTKLGQAKIKSESKCGMRFFIFWLGTLWQSCAPILGSVSK